MLDIAVCRIHPSKVKTKLGDPEKYRLVLAKILKSRYLYYEDFYKRPKRQGEEEEEKQVLEGENLAAVAKDFSENKSDVSAFTSKTTKSKGGKALDKHCALCNF